MMPFFLVQNKNQIRIVQIKKQQKYNHLSKYVNAVDCSMEKGHYHGTPARLRGVSIRAASVCPCSCSFVSV